jgi:hypothetical protein
MRRLPASLVVLGLVLVASLAAKGAALRQSDDGVPQGDITPVRTYLAAAGFDVTVADPNTAPIWITGTKGDCTIRIADVAPQGWFRSIVAEQAVGQELHYAFAGQFYADQPVLMTNYAEYRQRLLRYFGQAAPPPAVRAILVSPACPRGIVGPQDAGRLS